MKIFGNNGSCWTVSMLMFHPLLEYCKMIGVNILDDVLIPICLEGWRLDGDVCNQLASVLQTSIDRGNCKTYIDFYHQQHRAAQVICDACGGSGFSRIVRNGMTTSCPNCRGTGKALPLQFDLTVKVVQEFTNFLRESNGFVIRGASIAPSMINPKLPTSLSLN